MKARVKWFNNEKGYGFLEYNESKDVFVHYTQINREGYKTLNEGDNVTYELIETPKGYQAHQVELLDCVGLK